ncbi:MAG: hypothetical protein M1454_03790 [Candidatus Thermoplasmatota archaeon]|nr:hypothetical protein [Candidatus Thermoplasmatota archaeon]MCL5730868.1 hypothetical protein [Candidatus Thermoplasmatota archaeon]
MQRTMRCLYLEGSTIPYEVIQKLLREGSDSLFLVDRSGILKGRLNTKVYSELSKFFELCVMNFPRSVGQLQDTIISGASSVVISPDLPTGMIQDMSWMSENIILPYTNLSASEEFRAIGGSRYLSRGDIPPVYSELYYVGKNPPINDAILLLDFPEEMNREEIF